jgi:hypothetical protein
VKRILSIALIFIFALSILEGSKLGKAYGDVEIRNVAVSPSTVDLIAQYTVYIVLHKDLNSGENLYIKFPSECTIPQSINKELVEIAGYKPSAVTVSGNAVILTLSEPLLQNQGAGIGGVAVVFSSSIGIKNPSSPDVYSIEVWTTTEPNHSIYSFYIGVEVQGSTVSGLSVILGDNRAGKNSRYDISFTVTISGALIPGDYIDVYFPKGTTLPKTLDLSKVLINLASPSVVNVQERRVRVYVPESRFILPGSTCTIFFLQEFGIINPEFTGNFAIQVATSKDTGFATSNFYTLYGTSIQSLNIIAVPSSQKMNSEYTIKFKTSQITGLLTYDVSKINIKFTDAIVIPQFVKPGAISVNGIPCTSVTISGHTISLIVPVDVSDNASVSIVIAKEFGIENPEGVGSFEIYVNTSSDAVYVSNNVSITPSTISVPSVQLSNSSAGQISVYNVSFTTGVSGNLLPGIDRVNVILPVGTTIPTLIPTSTILVNGVPTTLIEISGTTLTITLPVEIKANGVVNISITEGAGIRNPVQSGNYVLYVFTTKEQTSVSSNSYSIKNVPQTTLKISPEMPDGLNEFYRTQPSISFTATSATDPNPTIYYYFDGNSPSKFTGTAIVVPEGTHMLYYYAVDKEEHKEEVKSVKIKVDTIPPQIVVLFPQDKANLNSKSLVVKGAVDIGSTVKVNGNEATIDSLGNFEASVEVLSSPQIINISATDLAGNSSQKVLTVYLDTTPPNLTIVKPVMFQQVSKLPLIIEGITEKGAKVSINGDSAEVREDGIFSYSLKTLPEGQFAVIEVVATDEAGNSTKKTVSVKYSKSIIMKLQVGNKTALINNETSSLEAAPVIKDGRTMVPLRFVGEAFGAEFTYDSVFKIIDINFGSDKIKMQMGKKTAIVNGVEIALDVAPYIVNGRTLVPIRFISETFGAEVVWDVTTKTVTIIYPKP